MPVRQSSSESPSRKPPHMTKETQPTFYFGDALIEKNLKAPSDHLARCLNQNLPDTQKTGARELVASHNSAYSKVLGRPTMYKVGASMTISIHTRKLVTYKDEDEALGKARSEAKKCHITTRHNSKDQPPKSEMGAKSISPTYNHPVERYRKKHSD
ncbi:hypothetical protein PIB30_082935 [Stylosanthes scabra]|uniref:Uncharacterized protein n=1 Tax=Stylosanthes scabra TaxID=79078 RepID=A0ABU6WTR0_9FABA|nr:hypothetical protein [Stylosanthes scabra]